MNGKTTGQGAAAPHKSAREQRLAAALRTNLRRRKAAPTASAESPEPPVTHPEPEDRP